MVSEESGDVTGEHRSLGHTVRIASGLVLVAVAVAIVVDNRRSTRVGYVVGDVRAPLILVLAVAAFFGAGVGWLLLHRPRHG